MNKIRTACLLVILLMGISQTKAQSLILDELVEVDSVKGVYGKNLAYYMHTFASYGLHLSNDANFTNDMIGSSSYLDFGLRFKRRIINFIHIGSDISYTFNHFRLKTTPIPFIDSDSYKHHLNVHGLNASPYLRFNFFNRGNIIAYYLDVYAYGQYNFSANTKEKYKYKSTLNDEFVKRKEVNRNKLFVDPFSYGLGIRIGYNKFAMFAQYSFESIQENIGGTHYLCPYTYGIQLNI